MSEILNRESRENKIIRRNGMVIAIMLSAILLIGMPSTISALSMSWISFLVSLPGLALSVIMCIGAWLISFKKPAGGTMVYVVMTIYRIWIYVMMGLLLIGAVILCILLSMHVPSDELMLGLAVMMLIVLFAEGALFFVSAIYTSAARAARYIKNRCDYRTMHGRAPMASALGVLLIILSVILGISVIGSLVSSIELMDEMSYYGSAYALGDVGELMEELEYELYSMGMGDVGAALSSLVGSGMSSIMLGVGTVTSILQLFVCIYGCCTIFSLKKASRS